MLLTAWLLCLLGSLVPGASAAGLPQERRNLFEEHGCCKRHPHHVYVGQDLSGSPLSIDVGLCQAHCGALRRKSPRLPDFPGLSKPSSMLDFLRAKKDMFWRSPAGTDRDASSLEGFCSGDSRCEASRTRVEEVSLQEGVRQVEVAEGCHCAPVPPDCLRAPAPKMFFPGSPLERTVDVGRCSAPPGPREGLFCLPIHFDTALLKGPNGHQAVGTVERCGWRPPCYRVPHVVSYLEIMPDGAAAGKTRERVKEIDLGRCLGKCRGGGNPGLQRGWQRPDTPLPPAERGAHGRCAPQRYEAHTFQTRDGELRTVLSVQTCGCGA